MMFTDEFNNIRVSGDSNVVITGTNNSKITITNGNVNIDTCYESSKKRAVRLKQEADEYKASVEKTHKLEQKKKFKTKFVVDNQYALRTKGKDGSKNLEKTFVLKKFIYTINDYPVNVLIMKQLTGEHSKIFTLNRNDCKLYHIKYEEGLQVWPMSMKWVKINKKEINKDN